MADLAGAFAVQEPEPAAPEPDIEPARAPLFEVAAAHDGQPAKSWLLMFYRTYGDLD